MHSLSMVISQIIKLKDTNVKNTHSNSKKSLLIYAHYYFPDVASTGQILKELAEDMKEVFNITVICVVPSYTGKIVSEYKTQKYYWEVINDVKVLRVRVPEFVKERKLSRIKNIIAYFFGAIIATFKVGKQHYIYSISQPPILGGVLGIIGKWIKHAKYIYNIQDFNPEQIIAVGYSKSKLTLKLLMWIDIFSCKNADKVIVVGRDMVETLKERFLGKKVPNYCFINNWINENEIYPLYEKDMKVEAFREKYGLTGKLTIMYSGNIGLYYDLENLLKVIMKFKDYTEVMFTFVGEGSVKNKLVRYTEVNKLNNVMFIPYQDKADLIYSLNAGDVHWVVNVNGIKGISVPSKIYGVMAVGKPVLGVLEKGAEARYIIEKAGCGLLAEPGDYEAIEKNIQEYIDMYNTKESVNLLSKMGMSGREYLIENLAKNTSVNKYIKEILEC